jgi:hypothetical protein
MHWRLRRAWVHLRDLGRVRSCGSSKGGHIEAQHLVGATNNPEDQFVTEMETDPLVRSEWCARLLASSIVLSLHSGCEHSRGLS